MRPEALFLIGASLSDIKDRRIHLPYAAAFAAIAAVSALTGGHAGHRDMAGLLSALIPGAAVFAAGALSGWKIGGGDGIALTVLGCYRSIATTMGSLIIGLFISSCFAVLLTASGRRRDAAFPFVPFLLGGYLIAEVL